MPWHTRAEARQHVKDLTDRQATVWLRVANSALARCLKADGKQAECEASALKQAAAIAQKIGEAGPPDAATLAEAYQALGVPLEALAIVVEVTQAALADLDADDLAEASTTKATVQGHLKSAADAMRAHKHPVAKMLTKHLDGMRSLLQSGYGGVGSLFEEPAPATEADTPPGADILVGLLMQEAASILRQDDSYDARRQAVQTALCQDPKTRVNDEGVDPLYPDPMGYAPYPWIVDLFDDVVIYQYRDDLYRRSYTIGGDDEDADDVQFGDPEPCERAYLPVGEAAVTERQMDKAVGGGTDRDKLPAEDFAGKDRSFPIATPQDVADAAQSIGRAGADNYSTDELRKRIVAIAKRKGAAFVAKLPAAWQGDAQESAIEPAPSPSAAAEAAAVPVALVEAGALVEWRDVAESGALVGAA